MMKKNYLWKKFRPRMVGIFHALLGRSIPLHRGEEHNPFFIVGSGRCGTTLLRRILQASDEVHIPPENWALSHVIHRFRQNSWFLNWGQLVDLVVAAHEHRSTRWFDKLPTRMVKEAYDLPESERSLSELLNRIYRYHGKVVGARFNRWGDKTPLNIDHMNSIKDTFPNAKFINMIRDGVDVVYSFISIKDHPDGLVSASHRWKSSIDKGLNFENENPKSIMTVRYEDLVTDTRKEIQSVCEFLGINYDRGMENSREGYKNMREVSNISHYENVFREITDKNVGKGRRNMDSDEKSKISDVLNSRLELMGYEKVM